jgi:hypothetical protein
MDATPVIKDFYMLEAVGLIVKPMQFKHSHERWLRDFNNLRNKFIDNLEQAIWDYTVLVSAGEMRHAKTKAVAYNPNLPYSGSHNRDTCFKGVVNFDPKSLLASCDYVFNKVQWKSSGYGGPKWGAIAQAAIFRDKWKNKVLFIDHCVDLTHNGNVYFDKEESNIFKLREPNEYKRFLDFKRDCVRPQDLLQCYKCSSLIADFIERAEAVGLTTNRFCWKRDTDFFRNYDTREVLSYKPIEWGTRVLTFEFKGSERYTLYGCEEDDDVDCEDCGKIQCKNNPSYVKPYEYPDIKINYSKAGERNE